jgi:hypothetical protein
MVEDPPAMKAAAEAGFEYTSAQMARINAYQALWRTTDQSVKVILAKPLVVDVPKPKTEYDDVACNPACRTQWDAYAAKMLPLMIARDTEVLKVRRDTLQKQRAAAAEGVRTADKHLLASQYGETSQSQVNQGRINAYDAQALNEASQLIDRLEEMVKSAAAVVNCGKQAVEVPLAVCR